MSLESDRLLIVKLSFERALIISRKPNESLVNSTSANDSGKYIIYDETKECIIIDPGCYEEKEKELLSDFIKSSNPLY